MPGYSSSQVRVCEAVGAELPLVARSTPGTLHRQHTLRNHIWACSCGGQLWVSDNAVVSVEDAHFQSQPCICFSCGRSFLALPLYSGLHAAEGCCVLISLA